MTQTGLFVGSMPVVPKRLDPAPDANAEWTDACALEDVQPGTGVAAIFHGRQIAIVRTASGDVYALSNFDPFSKAFVIARGIVGDRNGVPKIASPIYKQNFCLRTGKCLDDPSVGLETYPVRLSGDRIQLDLSALRHGE